MDKEQEILQKLERLRVEQLKALKELKKVEKAKKKQRRRTAHGYPVVTKSESNENVTTTSNTGVATPAQDESHATTSSKSCGNVDRTRMRVKRAQNLKREGGTTISAPNEDKSTAIKNTAYLCKTEINNSDKTLVKPSVCFPGDYNFNVREGISKPPTSLDQTPKTSRGKSEKCKKETVRYQKEVSGVRSNFLSENNCTISDEDNCAISIVPKPGSSPHVTPIPCQFSEKKTKEMPAHALEQIYVEKSTASHVLPKKAHSSVQYPSANSGLKKSKMMKTDSIFDGQSPLEKIKQLQNNTGTVKGKGSASRRTSSVAKESENSSTIKDSECTRKGWALKLTSTNKSSSLTEVKGAGKQLSKQEANHFEDRKEELHFTNSTVSTNNNKPFYSFSQNLFSQSLFDDTVDDQSAKDNLSDVCEPSSTKVGNNEKNVSKTGKEMAASNDEGEQIYNGEDRKQKSAVKNNDKMEEKTSSGRGSTDLSPNAMQSEIAHNIKQAVNYDSSFKNDTWTDLLLSNTLQRNDQISLHENEEMGAKASSPKAVAEITEWSSKLSANSLPEIFGMGGKVEDGNFFTNTKEEVLSHQAKISMPSKSMVSAKVPQEDFHSNASSPIHANDFKSRFLLQDTDRQLDRQELPPSRNNIIAEQSSVSEDILLQQKNEGMQCELIADMLIDLPQIFANELESFDTRSEFKEESVESEARKQTNNVPEEFKNLQFFEDDNSSNFDDLLLSQPSILHSENPLSEGPSSQGNTLIKREICLQHSLSSLGSCNKVKHIKFLTHAVGDSRLDMVAVCLSRLLVLWRAVDSCTSWTVMHNWLLEKDEEIVDVEVASVRSCIVLTTGGKFHKALGRVYCVHGENDCKFDIYEEVSFADLGEIAYGYQEMCLLPFKKSNENISIILASAFGGKIVLTKWTIDLICFCLEDCKDLPEVIGDEMSSLCLVQGSKCLLLGCVDSDVYLWNYNGCELLWRMTLQIGLFTRPVFLSAETHSGIIFLSLLHKEENKVNLVAINPETSREACLKEIDMVDVKDVDRNKLLHCSKNGPYIFGSFEHGEVFLWNIVTDSKTVFDQNIGGVFCISLHPEDSVIAFGTDSGCVYLDVF